MTATVAGTAAVAASNQVWNDMMAKVEELVEKFNAETLLLHVMLFAQRTTHAHASMNDIRFKWDLKRAVEEEV